MDAPDSDNIRTLNPDDPPQVETPPIDVGKTLVDLNKSIGLMSDLFVRFISAQADPAQPFERIQSDGELPSSFAHCSVSSAPTGPALSRLDEPLPDMSTGQNLSQGTHIPRGKRPIGPVFGSKAKKHKADTVDFDTVSLYASDEEDDTPSLTAEVAALLPSDKDTGNKGPEADETHVLLDELAKVLASSLSLLLLLPVQSVVVVTCGGQTFILSALKNSCFIANSFTFQMEADIETVLEATESLRSSSKGRHLDAVASFCSAKHGWDRTKTHAILDQAVCDGKLYTTMSHNKVSYRIQNQETIDTENEDLSRTSEMDFELPTSGEYVSVNDFKRLQVELEEFKRFSHGEILSLKAQIANRPSSPPQQTRVDPSEKDREALLGCLQDRIISLERQLCDKQKVIEFLLEGPRLQTKAVDGNKGCLDDETRFIPSGIQKLQETREPNVNSMKTKRLPKNEEAQRKAN